MAKKKLTHLQERFKNNILKGMHQDAAYIAAGYKARGAAARTNASRLLTNANIKAALNKGHERASKAAEVTCERLLKEYAKIAFLDPTLFFDENGNLRDVQKLEKSVAAAIGGMDILQRQTRTGNIEITKKIKLIDKKGALDSLARIKGMFNDKLNLGFSEQALNAILAGLPEEYAKAVRESLSNVAKGKKK